MRVVYAVIALLLIPSLSWAGNMTFQFRNPNFGGNPNNGSFLLNSAQAQNSYKDPSADDDFGIETPSALDNFTQAIQAQVLGGLLTNINTGKPGRMVTSDFIVDIANADGQMQIKCHRPENGENLHHSGRWLAKQFHRLLDIVEIRTIIMQRFLILVAVCLLSGCLTAPPKQAAKPTLMPRAQSYRDLTQLPLPTGKIYVSVYNIQDETGQFKPYPASNFSTAVPQSATAMLVTALKDSRWFIPLERQGLQNLLNERKIIRAAQDNGTVAMNNRIPLHSLTAANVMVEGSIIGYESNVKSGGVGARYFGIGGDTQYQLDQIAVNLRVVNVSTGEILSSVTTSKTILSYEVQAGVFRFIDYQRLLEGEIGYTSNEPVMLCLMSAIETGVIFLINDGIDRGLWDLQNKNEVKNDVLVKYREMSSPPES